MFQDEGSISDLDALKKQDIRTFPELDEQKVVCMRSFKHARVRRGAGFEPKRSEYPERAWR